MLTDYIAPDERIVACPNQDVVYGGGCSALDRSPVVMQVPDFGDRFWVYQVVDPRTDSFAELGKMYGTTPGFYLLVGPDWQGEVPEGITAGLPRFDEHRLRRPARLHGRHAEDRDPAGAAADHDVPARRIRRHDEEHRLEHDAAGCRPPRPASEEMQWVVPETFFEELAEVLADAPPLPGEEARYAQVLAVLERPRAIRR